MNLSDDVESLEAFKRLNSIVSKSGKQQKRKVSKLPKCLQEILVKTKQYKRKNSLYPCCTCGKLFKLISELRSHADSHLDEKKKPHSQWECCFCGQSFLNSTPLLMHQLAIPLQPICPDCDVETEPKSLDSIHYCSLHHKHIESNREERQDTEVDCKLCGAHVNQDKARHHLIYKCGGRHPVLKEYVDSFVKYEKESGTSADLLLRLELENYRLIWKTQYSFENKIESDIKTPYGHVKVKDKDYVVKSVAADRKYNLPDKFFHTCMNWLPPGCVDSARLQESNYVQDPNEDTEKLFILWNESMINAYSKKDKEFSQVSARIYAGMAAMKENKAELEPIKYASAYENLNFKAMPSEKVLARLSLQLAGSPSLTHHAISKPRTHDMTQLVLNKRNIREFNSTPPPTTTRVLSLVPVSSVMGQPIITPSSFQRLQPINQPQFFNHVSDIVDSDDSSGNSNDINPADFLQITQSYSENHILKP